ncbi:YhdP family protein [Kordiimonas sediminis]|uniref:YhdP family protein n=1 Tax=Kordiimonas sediminis TaxID=1735581 RepID=UPI00174965AD|nr:AsmA-like C-terminal domain-containing protein [Kordiimonas sediminis]
MSLRLLYAPIDLSFAQPVVSEQVSRLFPNWEIDYSTSEIGWDWSDLRPWIQVKDIKLTDKRGRLTIDVPTGKLGLDRTILAGVVSPAQINLDNAVVVIKDIAGLYAVDENVPASPGMLDDLFADSGAPTLEIFKPLTNAFFRVKSRMIRLTPDLDAIRFTNTRVIIKRDEGFEDAIVNAPRLLLTKNDVQDITLDALIDARIGGEPIQISTYGATSLEDKILNVIFWIHDINLAHIHEAANLPEMVKIFNIPASFEINASLSSTAGLTKADIKADIGEGFLDDPLMFPELAPVKYAALEGTFDPQAEVFTIDEFEASTGTRLVSGGGMLYWSDDISKPGVQFTIETPEASLDEILRYWPAKYHPDGSQRGGRAWVSQNMISGTGRNAVFSLNIDPKGQGGFEGGSKLRLDFGFDDIKTNYLKEMTPIINAQGSGVLTEHTLDIKINTATIDGLPVTNSRVLLEDIDKGIDATGTFTINLEGPVRQILNIIDTDPVNISQKIALDLDRIGGNASVEAEIHVPLRPDLPTEDVLYTVSADIDNAFVRDILNGDGISDGDLSLGLDPDILTIGGTAMLNGVSVDMHWIEDFKTGRDDPDADTTLLITHATASADSLKALQIDITKFVEGPVTGNATFTGRSMNLKHVDFAGESSGATLKIEELAYQRPSDMPFAFAGDVSFAETGTSVNTLALSGQNLSATGNIFIRPSAIGGVTGQLHFTELNDTKNLILGFSVDNDNSADIRLRADVFDARPILTDDHEQETVPLQQADNTDDTPAVSMTTVNLEAKKLLLLNDEILQAVKLETVFKGHEPDSIELTGTLEKSQSAVSFAVIPQANTVNALTIKTDDAGAFLRGMGLFSHLNGGSMEFTGETSGWGSTLYLKGKGGSKSNILVQSSDELGDNVTEGVIQGLDEYLKGDPISLTETTISLSYDKGLLDFDSVKANGASLGMTLEGQIHTGENKVNLNGVIVPAYGLNALFGKIPVIGAILTGGAGKGIFGFSYRVKGTIDDPAFNVNPLSGLAPGFLRLLFEGAKGKVSNVQTPEEKEKKPEDPDQNAKDTEQAQSKGEGDTIPSHVPA